MIRERWAKEDKNRAHHGDSYMHVYLTERGAIGVKSKRRPFPACRHTYVVYEWKEGKFCMAFFPEISPKYLCSDNFLYIGKIANPPIL